ncbi:MAG TPA: hypothetical protein VM784_03205, partial [Actinomycetota bacterium]|nr:hypothetical protein [Actinomycetota bacterium]
ADLSTFVPSTGYLTDVLPALVVFGIGLMIMVAPLTTALMRSVPVRNSGVASAFNNAISRVGPQLAGALIFVFISTTFYASLNDALPNEATSRVREQVSPLNPPPPDADPALHKAAAEASTDAFHVAMLIAAGMCLTGAAVNGLGIIDPVASEETTAGA